MTVINSLNGSCDEHCVAAMTMGGCVVLSILVGSVQWSNGFRVFLCVVVVVVVVVVVAACLVDDDAVSSCGSRRQYTLCYNSTLTGINLRTRTRKLVFGSACEDRVSKMEVLTILLVLIESFQTV